jgi:hypothetical protein
MIMGGFDGAELRRRRLEEFAQLTQAALFQAKEIGSIPLNSHVCRLMLKSGLTRGRVIEMLQLLNGCGMFELDLVNDKITRTVSGP